MATRHAGLGVPSMTALDRDPTPEMHVQLGRNLTYGMLDALGRSIVIGRYDSHAFPTEAELA